MPDDNIATLRDRFYEALRGIGCPHHLATSILDTYCHAYECASIAIAENARLRALAEVGEAVEGMLPGDVLLRASETKWRTGAGAMASTTNRSITIIHWADKVRNTALAALRAVKKTPTTKAVEANDE